MQTGLTKQPEVTGTIRISETDGVEILPGIFLIGEPSPRPDLGPTALVCLANIQGMLGLVQLSIKFRSGDDKKDACKMYLCESRSDWEAY